MAQLPKLSILTMQEIAEHEGLVLEAYKDSKGIWTWGLGVTDASGHKVARYRKTPSTIERAIEVFEWLLRTKYLPEVIAAFPGRPLTEAQMTAALSFHWNTGAIGRADWVQSWLAGMSTKAMREFMNWSSPREIIGRRMAERALFFRGIWSGDGRVTQWTRVHASGTPDWSSGRQVDLGPALAAALTKGS